MHRLAATPGGWTPETDGVIVIEQRKAPIVCLTAADTDVQLLASASRRLPQGFPDMRVASLLQLQQQFTIDTYAEDVLAYTKVMVVRLLGGRAYWSYGLEVLKQLTQQTGAALLVLPGDDRPDFELMSHSTVPLAVVDRLWRYFTEGGVENTVRALEFVADVCLGTNYNPLPPQPIPRVGLYQLPTPNPQPPTPKLASCSTGPITWLAIPPRSMRCVKHWSIGSCSLYPFSFRRCEMPTYRQSYSIIGLMRLMVRVNEFKFC
jgi:cobaltochelatase CobN